MKRLAAVLALHLLAFAAPLWGQENALTPKQARDHIGEEAQVCGRVESTRFLESAEGQPTFLNLGAPYPNHHFTVVIWGRHRDRFKQPERQLKGRTICVTGKIAEFRGKPQMEITSPRQVLVWTPEKGKAKEEKTD